MKNYVLEDITMCSPFKVNRCFGGACRLHIQDREYAKQQTSLDHIALHPTTTTVVRNGNP
jgi:hypothetical protein